MVIFRAYDLLKWKVKSIHVTTQNVQNDERNLFKYVKILSGIENKKLLKFENIPFLTKAAKKDGQWATPKYYTRMLKFCMHTPMGHSKKMRGCLAF